MLLLDNRSQSTNACTNLADRVVPGEVEVVSVSGLGDTSSGIYLLLLLVQHHLRAKDIIRI